MKSTSTKVRALNILGAAGYITSLLQWLWTIMIFLPWFIALPGVNGFFTRHETSVTQQTTVTTTNTTSDPLLSFFGLTLGAIVIVAILYVIVAKIPRSIAKTGETMTHKPAAVIAPMIIKHTHLKPAGKKSLSTTLIFSFKLFLIFTPLCLLAFAGMIPLTISFGVIMTIGIILFSWSLLFFVFQFLLSRYLKVDYRITR